MTKKEKKPLAADLQFALDKFTEGIEANDQTRNEERHSDASELAAFAESLRGQDIDPQQDRLYRKLELQNLKAEANRLKASVKDQQALFTLWTQLEDANELLGEPEGDPQ